MRKKKTFLKKSKMKKMPRVYLDHSKHLSLGQKLKENFERDFKNHGLLLWAILIFGVIIASGTWIYLNHIDRLIEERGISISLDAPQNISSKSLFVVNCVVNGYSRNVKINLEILGPNSKIKKSSWEITLYGIPIVLKKSLTLNTPGIYIAKCSVFTSDGVLEKEKEINVYSS